MGRKFWIGYSTGLAIYLGGLAITWLVRPTNADATAGLSETGGLPPRLGLIAAITIIPMILASIRLNKLTDRGSPAHVAIPVLLAIAMFVVSFIAAFLPDEIGCGMFNVERFGPLDPECTTAASTRLGAVAEGITLWLLFGGMTIGVHALLERRRLKKAASH